MSFQGPSVRPPPQPSTQATFLLECRCRLIQRYSHLPRRSSQAPWRSPGHPEGLYLVSRSLLRVSVNITCLNVDLRNSGSSWLATFKKYAYTAFWFTSLPAIANWAPMDVVPTPDIFIRVLVLFRGLSNEVAAGPAWAPALHVGPDFWSSSDEGPDAAVKEEPLEVEDNTLFRVYDVGAFEIVGDI